MRTLLLRLVLAFAVSEGSAWSATVDSVCGDSSKPMNGVPEPLKPANDKDEANFSFNQCKGSSSCNSSLGHTYKVYVSELKKINGVTKGICDSVKTDQERCTKQSETQACMAKMQERVASQFESHAKRLDAEAKNLSALATKNRTEALGAVKGDKTAEDKYGSIIIEARSEKLFEPNNLRGGQVDNCLSKLPGRPKAKEFCPEIVAFRETNFYAKAFGKVADNLRINADSFHKASENSEKLAKDQGAPDEKKEGGGLLDGVGGLDGLMKMATLGMTGAGMYCGMTGKCTPQQEAQEQAALGPTTGGATSPTPTSRNLGTDNPAGSGTSQETVAATNTDTKTSPGYEGGGGDSGSITESDRSGFDNSMNRNPASTPMTGGVVGGGGGAAAGGGDSPAAPAQKPAEDPFKGLDNGMALGGGGGGGAGSFNLDGGSHSPADAALKDILNGDTPAGGDPLAGLEDPGVGGETQADVGEQDSDNLFLRINASYVRCLKRGCVARGVGERL